MSKPYLLIAGSLLLFFIFAFGQQPSAPAVSEGRIKLDVVVTDKQGKPVSGLGPDDFTLLDNNQPSKILSFHAVDGTPQRVEPPIEVVLLVDALNVGPEGIALMQTELERFLRQNGGHLAHPISLYLLNDQGLNGLSQPSVDGNALAAEVGKIENRFRTINSSGGEWGLAKRLALSVQSLLAISQREANRPRRKLLIWIGPGWPTWDVRKLPTSPSKQHDCFSWIVQLSTRLREAHISVYTTGTSYEYERFLKAAKSAEEANVSDLALGVLAVQSGGRVLGSARDKDLGTVIDRCIQESSASYALSFDPPHAGHANEYHDLTVQIGKPGLTARTNTGYYNQPKSELTLANARPSADLDADRVAGLTAKPVTVAELELALKDAQRRPDAEAARQLSGLVLTERLSDRKLSILRAGLPGAMAQEALVTLADASVFLSAPQAEIPGDAPPELATQRLMVARTIDYLGETIPKLPDFYATRLTAHYEEFPQKAGEAKAATPAARPLHLVDRSSATVLYRDGHEVVDAELAKGQKKNANTRLLITRGTFGPILSVTIVDAANGQLKWSRWEKGEDGLLAVFHFAVPREKSHYVPGYDISSFIEESDNLQHPTGYHGEIAIDPATGTILRLVIEADLESGSPLVRAGIMVEYGPVEIGAKTYFCPVRSVSISRGPSTLHFDSSGKLTPGPAMTMLNDVAFGEYHLFRAEMRIESGDNLAPDGK